MEDERHRRFEAIQVVRELQVEVGVSLCPLCLRGFVRVGQWGDFRSA